MATIAAADVIGALDGEQPTSALFASYTFSPGVFATEYVRPLLRRGCGRIVAIVDRLGWAQSLAEAPTVDGPGTNYYLRCADLSDSFHPKLSILRTATRAVVSLGSGNLTAAGLALNAETGLLAVVDDEAGLRALDDLSRRIERVGGFDVGPPNGLGPVDLGGGTLLLTSLDRALLPCEFVPADVGRIEIVSPFLDHDLEALAWMRASWPSAAIRLRTDPRCTKVSDRLLDFTRKGLRIEVPDENEGERTPVVHGKLYAWYSGDRAHVWIGSPNLSGRALLEHRNVEMVAAMNVSAADADGLLHVPQVRWRRLRDSDGERFCAAPPRPPSCSDLVAEFVGDTLRIRLPRPERAACSLRLLRGGRVVHRAEVLFDLTGRAASLAIDPAVAGVLEGTVVVEVEGESGGLYRGWLEQRAQLDAPPELRAQLGFLRDFAADPARSDEDETVAFLRWVSAQLGAAAAHWRWGGSPTRDPRSREDDGSSVSRERFLEAEGEIGGTGFRVAIDVTVGALDRAVDALRFFSPEAPSAPSTGSDPTGAARPETGGAPPSSSPRGTASVPERIRKAVETAVNRYSDAVAAATDVQASARLLLALPVVVRTLAMCRRRWGLEAWGARIHLIRILTAILGPGRSSLVGTLGLLTRISAADRGLLAASRHVSNAVGVAASLLVMVGGREDGIRADVARDMFEVLDRFGVVERSPVAVAAALGEGENGDIEPIDLVAVERHIRSVPGEIGLIAEQRRQLRVLVARAAAGADRSELLQIAANVGLHEGCRRDVLEMLCRLAAARRPVRLVETQSETTPCPECGCALPTGKAGRLVDASFVAMDDCGVLFVKGFDL